MIVEEGEFWQVNYCVDEPDSEFPIRRDPEVWSYRIGVEVKHVLAEAPLLRRARSPPDPGTSGFQVGPEAILARRGLRACSSGPRDSRSRFRSCSRRWSRNR